jgi:enoyl-CoA hydratase/carnithine racemase
MPETRIGLFPDVGASWFLARAPGAIGRYLAATGATIGAADALYARLADAYLDDAALPGLIEALKHERLNDGVDIVRFVGAECVKHKVTPTPDASPLAAVRTSIDKHFAAGDGKAILASLEKEADGGAAAEWARETIAVTRNVFEHGDVVEGIRARIVDKDNEPAWKVARLEDVTPEEVKRMLESPWSRDHHPLKLLKD